MPRKPPEPRRRERGPKEKPTMPKPRRGRPVLEDCHRLWTTADVSEFLGVPVQTLWYWSHIGEGPPTFKVGRHLRYDPDEVRRWLVEECRREASA